MKISSKIKDYTYEFIDDALSCREMMFGRLKHNRRFFFVDENFFNLYQKRLRGFFADDFVLVVPAREENKEYIKLADYYRALITAGFTRADVLTTLGGGILQDISGFVASTLYRGIKWIFIPTTLLAQADSCIGSKTSINFGSAKNLIGGFYPPDNIFIDPFFCRTLTPQYFNSGLGEIIKFHLLSDSAGYGRLQAYLAESDLRLSALFKQIIESTLAIKKSYFQADEFDIGRRNLLNYGHCFGHALESASGFSVSHGEAVIVGMGFANMVAYKRGVMNEAKYTEFEEILRRYYPRFDLPAISAAELINYLKLDKKRVGRGLTMVLLKDVGEAFKFDDLSEHEFVEAYVEFIENYPVK